jgi:hypothetical protein
MATRATVRTAQEYAQALIPHLDHESYRCDQPLERLMGKGCRTCGVEAVIAIADFQATGDLEVYEREMKPFVKKGKK